MKFHREIKASRELPSSLVRGSLAALVLAITLTVAAPANAQPPAPAPMTQQAQNNRPYLLVFPVIVLGIIGALVIITRKK